MNAQRLGSSSPTAAEYDQPLWLKIILVPFVIAIGVPLLAIAIPLGIIGFIGYKFSVTKKYFFACDLEDFVAPKNCKRTFVKGRDVVLAKVGDSYFAMDNTCPHSAGDLSQGSIIPDLEEIDGEACPPTPAIICPLHHWVFRFRDDTAFTDHGQNTYATKVDGKKLYIEMDCFVWN
eukprot:TRINITY_DN1605_c0_g1::TRINITY_DN1605_c0_g1_i1::g.17643::m.17643 TRINITY_DN1605_c0_g1::TRINITY_DN1605_c0_g1_i1::g.17643  ORF type:complete len:190 (+),score=62.00,Rieske/PF00355.21/9e-08,Rieske_2/PF13806.1/1.7e-06,DUF3951/PF13131.1/1.2,SKG6/PF08693.5/7.3 TRINITY_DN1605_c0_g1_i1:44-571(+)